LKIILETVDGDREQEIMRSGECEADLEQKLRRSGEYFLDVQVRMVQPLEAGFEHDRVEVHEKTSRTTCVVHVFVARR
jgi:hypothetical protein